MSAPEGLVVIPVKSILSVVSMFPDMQVDGNGRILETGKFSLVRQAFLELTQLSDGQLDEGEDTEVTNTTEPM
jgi:hypothetical protein